MNFEAILAANINSKLVKEFNRSRLFALNLSAMPIALFDKNLVHKVIGLYR